MKAVAKAAPILLLLAVATGAEARDTSITIRLKAVKGRIESIYRGKMLTDAKFAELCAASRARKAEINFDHGTMNSNDTMSALLKEADCLGAKRPAGTDKKPAPKSSTQTHAKPRHKASTQP